MGTVRVGVHGDHRQTEPPRPADHTRSQDSSVIQRNALWACAGNAVESTRVPSDSLVCPLVKARQPLVAGGNTH